MIDKKHYKDALFVQSACNLSGVVFSFAKAMESICQEARENNHGTEWKNNHPICKMFAEQIYHLVNKNYDEAYVECQEKVS